MPRSQDRRVRAVIAAGGRKRPCCGVGARGSASAGRKRSRFQDRLPAHRSAVVIGQRARGGLSTTASTRTAAAGARSTARCTKFRRLRVSRSRPRSLQAASAFSP
jgi:hypothetical protein